jgi:hypothetical protein
MHQRTVSASELSPPRGGPGMSRPLRPGLKLGEKGTFKITEAAQGTSFGSDVLPEVNLHSVNRLGKMTWPWAVAGLLAAGGV